MTTTASRSMSARTAGRLRSWLSVRHSLRTPPRSGVQTTVATQTVLLRDALGWRAGGHAYPGRTGEDAARGSDQSFQAQ
jgi:hypothetical protein